MSMKPVRSKKMAKRRARASRAQEQLRAINQVLVNPAEFKASLKRYQPPIGHCCK
jgi:hypothetical protein